MHVYHVSTYEPVARMCMHSAVVPTICDLVSLCRFVLLGKTRLFA